MEINSIDQAIDFIYSSYLKAEKLLDYDLQDKFKRNPEFTRRLISQLQYEEERPNILVTGSKGKGSVSIMISEILQTGFKSVGLFTSPHVLEFNERIRVNKALIDDESLVKYTKLLFPYVEEIDLNQPAVKYFSPIGILAVIALLYFKDRNTDINVLECGKGALYDDVNVIHRDYSVINTIFLEHRRELGNTIEEVAIDKAAIIKCGQRCAYTAKQEDTVLKILNERAERNKVLLKSYGKDFYCSDVKVTREGTIFNVHTKNKAYKDIRLPLLGEHQAQNCSMAIAVCEDINGELDEVKIKQALKDISWPGRLEIIGSKPVTILDACINRSSAKFVKEVLLQLNTKQIVTVIGVPADKDYEGVIEEMAGISNKVILTTSANPHYKFSEEQHNTALKYGKDIMFIRDVKEALDFAKKQTFEEGILCIIGTTALVSDVKKIYGNN